MDKEKNLQYWIDHWQAEEHQRRSHEELWDNRADFFNEKVFTDDKIHSEVVDYLKEKAAHLLFP